MMYVYIFIGILAIIALSWLLIGLSLPRDRIVSRTVFIKAPIEKVWNTVTDVSGQIFWRSDLKRVEIKASEAGQDVWVEVPNTGKPITLKALKTRHQALFQVEILPNAYFKGYWEGEFIKNQSGTTLRIKETSRVDNPLFRPLVSLFFDPDKMVDRYQGDLKRHLGC